jgi:hypothetical protein
LIEGIAASDVACEEDFAGDAVVEDVPGVVHVGCSLAFADVP